jgi:hypothetical protein
VGSGLDQIVMAKSKRYPWVLMAAIFFIILNNPTEVVGTILFDFLF